MNGVAEAVSLLAGRQVAVLTGAGCSTDSGIPDYGGLHSTTRASRIQYKAFMKDPAARQRYWARSSVGWARVANATPNVAHRSLDELEQSGTVTGIITQNVDGLHHKAGNQSIVELHGTLSRVRCTQCDNIESRASIQERLLTDNPFLQDWTPGAADDHDVIAAPDGDAELDDQRMARVVVPECLRCGGLLKPDVVFFGESVPSDTIASAWQVYEAADVLLTVGTSLAVFSGYRFVLRAAKEGKPVVIVNGAETRGDEQAAAIVRGPVSDIIPAMVNALMTD